MYKHLWALTIPALKSAFSWVYESVVSNELVMMANEEFTCLSPVTSQGALSPGSYFWIYIHTVMVWLTIWFINRVYSKIVCNDIKLFPVFIWAWNIISYWSIYPVDPPSYSVHSKRILTTYRGFVTAVSTFNLTVTRQSRWQTHAVVTLKLELSRQSVINREKQAVDEII